MDVDARMGMSPDESPLALVTGSSSGIGLHLATADGVERLVGRVRDTGPVDVAVNAGIGVAGPVVETPLHDRVLAHRGLTTVQAGLLEGLPQWAEAAAHARMTTSTD